MELTAIKIFEKLGGSVQNSGLPSCYTGIGNIFIKKKVSSYIKKEINRQVKLNMKMH